MILAKAWKRAEEIAAQTPPARNRCVDLLRASSIIIVVLAHWLMAAPWVDGAQVHMTHLLKEAPWSRWMTWILQVMPIFFFVGGYSNGISWKAAHRDRKSYGEWLTSRLTRLLHPLMALLLFWTVLTVIAHQAGVPAAYIRVGSQIALVPTWFLAVYSLVVLAVPVTYSAWRRWGMTSFFLPAILAAIIDLLYFRYNYRLLGWLNYPLIWFAIHQLGYAWLEGRFSARVRALVWCLGGIILLAILTELGPWPRSLVGVPGEDVSNTTPPHIPILALGAFQFGLVMLLEPKIARFLSRSSAWTATVLVNGTIMSVFLWHSTAMMLLFGASLLAGGVGLHAVPASGEWWLVRTGWVIAFFIALLPFVALFGRFERPPERGSPPATWRMTWGTLLLVGGIAVLALDGTGSANVLGIKIAPLVLTFAGAELAGVGFLESRLQRFCSGS